MKKKILVIWFFILSVSLSAQTQCDSIITYNQIKKWAAVKLTLAYMEDYANTLELDSIEKNTLEELKKKYLEFHTGIDLHKFRSDLKNGWSSAESKVFQKYLSEFQNKKLDSISTLNFKYIVFTPKKVKNDNRAEAINEINNKYQELLVESASVTEINERAEKDSQVFVKNKKTNTLSFFDLPIWVYVVLAVIASFILFLYHKNVNRSSTSKNAQNSVDRGYSDRIKDLENKNEELKRKIGKLERELNTYKKDNNQMSGANDSSIIKKNPAEPKNNNGNSQNIKGPDPTSDKPALSINLDPHPGTKEIYLPFPYAERRFSKEEESDIALSSSFFKITYSKEINTGKIIFLDNNNLSKALFSHEDFLKPVCDYKNPYFPGAKGIKVAEDGEGKVELDGNDWVVTKKIQISFF